MNKRIPVLVLAQVAVLLAMEVMLSRFFSIATPVTKFSFAFVPLAICGALFGPVYGGIMGGLADLLGAGWAEESNLWDQAPEHPAREDIPPSSKEP